MTGRQGWTLVLALWLAQTASGEEVKKPVQVAAVTNPTSTAMAAAPVGTSTTTAGAPSTNFFGALEIRPSWAPNGNVVTSEDYAELGYRVSADTTVSYAQNFLRTLYSPTTNSSDLLGSVDAGLFRAKVNNLWIDSANGLSLAYEQRLYLPTAQRDRDAGMIAISRNYVKLAKKINEAITLTVMELPILAVYERAGTLRGSSATANPIFQNRLYLLGSFNLTKSLNFTLPVMFHQTRYRDFQANARNNDSWDFLVWTYPELTWQVDSTMSFGIAYYSDNLVKPDLSGLSIAKGLENGIIQVVATASL